MQSGFSNRLTAIRLRMKVLLVVAEVILAVALTVQLVALNAGLSSALVRKNEAFVKLIALQYQDASNKMVHRRLPIESRVTAGNADAE